MTNPRLEDHVVGLELQLVELVEQRERAEVQGRRGDAQQLQQEIDSLQAELAASAEQLSDPDDEADPPHLAVPTASDVLHHRRVA